MKFHTPSFLLGVGVAVTVMSTRSRLRPVTVELSALGVHLGRLGRAIVERQWEHAEDLWAEVGERVRDRDEDARERRAAVREAIGGARSPVSGGAARARA